MKITRVEAIVLRLPRVTAACDGTQDTCLVRVDSDAGLSGWGEADSCPTAVKAVIDAPLSHQICDGLANAVTGLDPLAIEVCAAQMERAVNYYGRSGLAVHAMAAVDMALWDLKGKALGQPVYRLLGGPFRTRLRAYASVLFGDTPDATRDAARRWADRGFTAVKFGWGPMGRDEATDVALVREARRGLGEAADLLVDAGQCFDVRTAVRRAHQFAEYRPYWLEEMLRPDDLAGYRMLSAASPTPIAAGESDCRPEEFERLMDEGGVDWVQPDPARCGVSAMLAIGRAAIRRRRRACNHTFKSGVTVAASLHVMASLPEADMFELCMADSPLRSELTRERFEAADGYVRVPDGPGLGVTVDPEVVARFRVA
jgi:L-alanine-DL-glutamate epimerase-like enolase superfamily enzyme